MKAVAAPAGPAYVVAGAGGVAIDLVAVGVVVGLVGVSRGVLAAFLLNVVVSAFVSGLFGRRALRRVGGPASGETLLVRPASLVTGRLVSSALTVGVVVALSLSGRISPAVLGAGLGAKIALLWSARQIARFERDQGSQVLLALRRRRGQPALFAA